MEAALFIETAVLIAFDFQFADVYHHSGGPEHAGVGSVWWLAFTFRDRTSLTRWHVGGC